tara:strand:- start:924 stop:1148 length:225 start_codon:yes stop_codon:yes gene_type:complete
MYIGYSSSRDRGEVLTNTYGCFPISAGGIHTEGAEFILSARASVPYDYTLDSAEALLQQVVADVVKGVVDGTIM